MKKIILSLVSVLCLLSSAVTLAASSEPLAMEKAFQMTATAQDAHTLSVKFKIAPQYYLYKNHFRFQLDNPSDGTLGKAKLPVAIKKHVEDLGVFDVYTDLVQINLPLNTNSAPKTMDLMITYQGCSDNGYCYPPTTQKVTLDLTKGFGHYVSGKTVETPMIEEPPLTEQDEITSLLSDGGLWTILISFFGFGILLAFTPCVLPMVPILSSIIVGQKGQIKTGRAFSLSLTYVLAMSTTYAIAGLLVGYVGGSLQAAFQQPWIIVLASLIFVALALSLFGFYEIRLPSRLQNRLNNLSNQQKGGSFVGAAAMGSLASLIVSPCVTPALVGALGYIAGTGDALIGGIALFTLGLGMGTPLMIIGTAGGKLLPKAGTWMSTVSNVFGIMMLAMAIWMLDRILPGSVILVLWGTLAVICAVFLGVFSASNDNKERVFRGIATVLLLQGGLLLVGASLGNTDPLKPLEGLYVSRGSSTYLPENYYETIKKVDEVKEHVKQSDKIVMLDFTADWCTACKIMEKNVFKNPEITPLLDHFKILKANVTHNDSLDKELQQHYGIVAPPTVVFIKPNGEEITEHRIVGEMSPKAFREHLEQMMG